MSNNKERISNDINKLITTINKNSTESFKEEMRSHAHNVLSSLMGRNSRNSDNEDPVYWKNQILNKVQKNYDPRSVHQCQQACNRVVNSSAITKKAEVFRMLFQLSKASEKMGENLDDIFTKSPNKIQNTQNTSKSNVWNPKDNLSQTQMTYNNQSYNNQSYNNITQNNITGISKELRQIRFRGSVTSGISEDQILKQITFRLQNIRSQLITTDNEGYSALRPTIDVSNTVRRIVRQLSEIGWLYGKVMDEGEDGGPIKKALKLAVRQQMSEYYRWLAVIENMIKSSQLNLRKLVLWAYQPFEKIKWLAIVLQAAKPFEGCQIISIINSYRPQGSNSINELLNRLIHHLLQPLFQYICNWVYRGQLTDTSQQFFIKLSKQKIGINEEWAEWNNKFQLDLLKIPNVLDEESAVQIFNAGKTLYFLKNHCKEDYHLDIPSFDSKTIHPEQISQSTTILSPAFKAWLKSVSDMLNKKLVQIMFDKFLLKRHLNSIKMFYLIGQGDFIQKLMDSLKGMLMKPKHLINQYQLIPYIEEAITHNFPNLKGKDKQFFKAEITDRLLPKKIDNGPDGWDVFNFQYHVTDPVNTVISPESIVSYQKIFHFLWKVKRVEQSLKEVWMNSIKEFHGTRIPVFHQCQLLHQSMTHFINNLFGYLMISIESAWNTFCQKINAASSLDSILEDHKKLVEELVQITLCNHKSKHSSAILSSIFTAIIKFGSIQERLTNNFTDFYEKKRVYSNRKNLIMKGLEFDDELQPPIFKLERLDEEVVEIREMYQKTFDRFFTNIKKEASNGDSRISTLCFRLDFNGFYSKVDYYI